ncbi:protease inhibitor I42 family protein [Lysobacter sp. UC]|uniref:Protease inhibitor I42 family protein n=1 Tax=Lysobacter arvi TaxID=3038776 RepID=A0ABU1CGG6_9GAMM|nr:protease inhibitor I42 family protein [Lysobacter arvi]
MLLPAALLCGAAGTPAQDSERSHLRVGQALHVRLTASPATGHVWDFVGPLPPELRMERDPGLAPFDRTQPGAASIQTWTFRAARPGRAVLRFVYRRPWDPDATAAERREVDVVVE